MSGSSPEMSVVIVTPDGYETIRKTVKHLRAQTVKDRLELVIVASSIEQLGPDHSDLSDFFQFRIVEVGEIRSITQALAAGIRQASAPVVVLAEDHSFPEGGWAEALIERHQQSWAVVGPVVRNANPDSLMSWADFLLGYGTWLEPTLTGETNSLPGHNSSYKRQILLDYGHQLEAMLEAEFVLHEDLQAKGYRLYLEPAAKTAHLNFAQLIPWMPYLVHAGRVFAAARTRQWSLRQRLLYAGGAPLIPFVRLWRIRSELRRPGRPSDVWPRVLPVLLGGLILDTVGQMLGYAFGVGKAHQKLLPFEFHRDRYCAKRNRQMTLGC
jgi:GT2 family glycosyltransferase